MGVATLDQNCLTRKTRLVPIPVAGYETGLCKQSGGGQALAIIPEAVLVGCSQRARPGLEMGVGLSIRQVRSLPSEPEVW